MPTRPEAASSGAAASAATEANRWLAVADAIPAAWSDVASCELAVIGVHDPADDLDRRAAKWTHRLPDHSLESLALFAAALARSEGEAWERDEPHIATRAYEARRFLAADRIVHWAVPWLDTVGRCYPHLRLTAHDARDVLLGIADHLRVAPDLGVGGASGASREDAYGPLGDGAFGGAGLRSLWSGALLFDATLVSMTGTADVERAIANPAYRRDLAALYWIAAARWSGLAERHPGSASLWRALAARADHTSSTLAVA